MKSMTIANVLSGFKVTGIYPVNRQAVLDTLPTPPSPVVNSKLYIPLCSPLVRRPSKDQLASATTSAREFSEEEMIAFQKLFEEGSLMEDDRYYAWLAHFHPTSLLASSHVWMGNIQSTSASKFISHATI